MEEEGPKLNQREANDWRQLIEALGLHSRSGARLSRSCICLFPEVGGGGFLFLGFWVVCQTTTPKSPSLQQPPSWSPSRLQDGTIRYCSCSSTHHTIFRASQLVRVGHAGSESLDLRVKILHPLHCHPDQNQLATLCHVSFIL